MKKFVVAGVAALALLGTSAVYAQHRDWHGGGWRHGMSRMSPEDRLAFVDARIAAVKAGLKLTPDQEKNWPAIETAVRDFAKQRIDRANASADKTPQDDPIARLRERADRMATTGAGLKRIADAAEPLYKTLDEGQKRRLAFLTRGIGGHHRFGGMHDRDGERGGDRGDRGGRDTQRDGGSDRL
ncbi:Spy/CpxP family protein refolding chaperone [Bradyrhizobium sp. U87765 SZCCT0131]|uniref:Spy/CpxP family protein refolding chaperone n=1 Tax=unclassified Bradyrhizobium TaxID=2631580 RepID=UPI001BAA5890|nr:MULTISPECIES: Spy/CpxP family protein refolding chaperone [unclassified Bradyrhizobium]MBR1222196.1 Spy/CpxP family protein refolding chaperone [Bradyrhizobium sp. U87765 SZCCT0131]MBR1265675.1 Spy/CpxP family protein refolding chaperone [Bradyrhizobium sp. U87765 SZCCT0134]MBR1307897.1 Spy/CpxP family protein refolding chaperone [Bradyrhizobium sp. U87765 SZCCT0110]MBR1323993.1 Spy/CpxP family protein refolding chaperone [Bradyrhizobium sp. U87765 SZCCT0109]MBR1348317.1 Spy/CpxP family pro